MRFQQTGAISSPYDVMQKHPHTREPEVLRPAQFAIDGFRIPGIRLPHLNWLMAVLGVKLHPTNHGFLAYQALACSAVHRARASCRLRCVTAKQRQQEEQEAETFHI
jgi:hypothetical protein